MRVTVPAILLLTAVSTGCATAVTKDARFSATESELANGDYLLKYSASTDVSYSDFWKYVEQRSEVLCGGDFRFLSTEEDILSSPVAGAASVRLAQIMLDCVD